MKRKRPSLHRPSLPRLARKDGLTTRAHELERHGVCERSALSCKAHMKCKHKNPCYSCSGIQKRLNAPLETNSR
jgi:hypothetical protein